MYPINVTQYLEKTVRLYPDRIAVIDGEKSLTFARLHEKILAWAAKISHITDHAVNQVIVVYMPKCLDAVIADLAIVYSGNAYMNLDVKSPPKRMQAILETVNPKLLIIREDAGSDKPDKRAACKSLVITPEIPHLDDDAKINIYTILNGMIDTDLLCLINTSGSTGVPKTVALNHKSFIDFTEAVIEAGLVRDNEIVGSLSPIIFDIFSFELCMLMAKGSTLNLVPENLAAFPPKLLANLAEQRVSFIFWVPTIMVNIANLELLEKLPLPHLKMIWFAGEVFPTPKFNYWRKYLPDAVFANFYGPIEITLDCVYYIIDRPLKDTEPIPIGKPFRNTSVLVLGENGENITARTPNKEGELCIRGSSLAMGYYNNPEKTALAFTQNPLNNAYPETVYHTGDIVSWNEHGELIFLGRKDSLIKHSGYRIELGEIESGAINCKCGISNACAVYDSENKKIILIYEAPENLQEKELRLSMQEFLPKYMLPTIFIRFKELPRNSNGKIDRNLLKQNWKNYIK